MAVEVVRQNDNDRFDLSIDEYASISPRELLFTADGIGGRRYYQKHRCAQILAVARRLLAEKSYVGVTVRDIARLSEVTPPTVYNLLGSKYVVLRQAVEEIIHAVINLSARRAKVNGFNPLLVYIDTLWIAIASDPEYYANAFAAIDYFQPKHAAVHLFKCLLTEKILEWLESMAGRGEFRNSVIKLDVVSQLMVCQVSTALAAWVNRSVSVFELRCALHMGTAVQLLGLVNDDEAVRIEAWLKLQESKSIEGFLE